MNTTKSTSVAVATGNLVKDGKISRNTARICRRLDRECRRHKGELILVVEREEKFLGCTGFGYSPREEDCTLDVDKQLGVLVGGGLVFKEHGFWEFPTGRRYAAWNHFTDSAQLIDEANLSPKLSCFVDHYLGRPIENFKNPYAAGWAELKKRKQPQLEIRIGNEAVIGWFENAGHRGLLILKKLAAVLGYRLPVIAKLDQETTTAHQGIVQSLVCLIDEFAKLSDYIGAVYDRIGQGAFIEGGALTMVESKSDAFFHTWGKRDRLSENRAKITRLLFESEGLGFTREQTIQAMVGHYRSFVEGIVHTQSK